MSHLRSVPRDTEEDAPGDERVVAAARADPRAFAPLYARYVRQVYQYCYLRLGERAAAEDATSDVFMKAVAGLSDFRGGAFAAWLFRIAHNVVHDAYRRTRPTAPLDAVEEHPDPDLTPEDAALARSRLEAVRQALDTLPETQRHALELQLAGWSVAESAAVLGTSMGAVKVLRFRALRRLRSALAETGWDDRAGGAT